MTEYNSRTFTYRPLVVSEATEEEIEHYGLLGNMGGIAVINVQRDVLREVVADEDEFGEKYEQIP